MPYNRPPLSKDLLRGETEPADLPLSDGSWYAQRGIPEYWIVDQTPERADDDGLVQIHRLTLSGAHPAYVRERTVPLDGFFRGLYETALGPGEVLTAVHVAPPPPAARSRFTKYT